MKPGESRTVRVSHSLTEYQEVHPEDLRFRFTDYPLMKHTAGCELSKAPTITEFVKIRRSQNGKKCENQNQTQGL